MQMFFVQRFTYMIVMIILLQSSLQAGLRRAQCDEFIASNIEQDMLTCGLCLQHINTRLDHMLKQTKVVDEEKVRVLVGNVCKFHQKSHQLEKMSPSRSERKAINRREINEQLRDSQGSFEEDFGDDYRDELAGYVGDEDEDDYSDDIV